MIELILRNAFLQSSIEKLHYILLVSLSKQFVHINDHSAKCPFEDVLLADEHFAPEISCGEEVKLWNPLLLSYLFDEQAKLVDLNKISVLICDIQRLSHSAVLKNHFSSLGFEEYIFLGLPWCIPLFKARSVIFSWAIIRGVLGNLLLKVLLLLQ